MITIRDRDFRIIRTSHNLRGILDYSARVIVERVDIWETKTGAAQLGVTWTDGSSCITDFASFAMCLHWCAGRRAFPVAIVHPR